MLKQIFVSISTLLILGLGGCAPNAVEEKNEPEATVHEENTASSLPGFSMKDEEGNTVNLASLKGKKVFVNLWASWCPPCRAEMPSIQKLADDVDKDKVKFVMLSLDESMTDAKQFIVNTKLEMPFYYPAEPLPALFNVPGIPATFIFDESGNLVKRVDGVSDYDTDEYRNLLK